MTFTHVLDFAAGESKSAQRCSPFARVSALVAKVITITLLVLLGHTEQSKKIALLLRLDRGCETYA